MVHGVVERPRAPLGHHPQLLRLLGREAARGEPGRPRRARVELRVDLPLPAVGLAAAGVDVVGLGGPPEERGPPAGGGGGGGGGRGGGGGGGEAPAARVGSLAAGGGGGGGGGPDAGGREGEEAGGHSWVLSRAARVLERERNGTPAKALERERGRRDGGNRRKKKVGGFARGAKERVRGISGRETDKDADTCRSAGGPGGGGRGGCFSARFFTGESGWHPVTLRASGSRDYSLLFFF